MRTIGLDVHREFAEVAIVEGGAVRAGGQIATTPEALRLFAQSLAKTDEVAIEATVNTFAIARLLDEYVTRVVISNPLRTRAIAEAKVKTDKVDARVLAELLAAGYLPGIWRPDEDLQALRRLVARRGGIVRERTRLKNQVQAILHRNLLPRCPAADLFGKKGGPGSASSRSRPTSRSPSPRRCAGSTSPARSSPSSTASWPRLGSPPPR